MRLTQYLLKTVKSKIRDPYVPAKIMPGNIWTGKHRLYEPVTISQKRAAVNQLLLEEQNREYLAVPYLTREQEHGSMKEKQDEKWRKLREAISGKSMRPNRFLVDALEHLNHNKRWE
ncbi:large ribosomal subunit protein mL63-like [Tubulanus polymorphus]|uniref:large ribosomal subunit protein mL63-like n=1 Tax=Tubulanus polymorphus TaxID=672921 RepID=UPI003DA67E61